MSNFLDDEIAWWKNQAILYKKKKAAIRPISFEYLSKAFQEADKLSRASEYDTMRMSLWKESDKEIAAMLAQDKIDMEDEVDQAYRNAYQIETWKNQEKEAKANKKNNANGLLTGTGYMPVNPNQSSAPAVGSSTGLPNGSGVQPYSAATSSTYLTPNMPASVVVPSAKTVAAHDSAVTSQNKLSAIGIHVASTVGNFIAKTMDLISSTTYASNAMQMESVKQSKSADSPGGTNITLAEHIGNLLPFSPVKTAYDLATGQGSHTKDLYKAAWDGLRHKTHITGQDVMREEYPNFSKEHSTLSAVAGFGREIATDPLTYATIGEGTAVRLAGAGALKIAGKKAAARALMEETIFTKAGRQAGKEAVETWAKTSAAKNAVKPLVREEKKLTKVARKAAEKAQAAERNASKGPEEFFGASKARQLSEEADAALAAQRAAVDAKFASKFDEDIKGIDLFLKSTIKSKTLGLGAIAAFDSGVKGASLVSKTALAAKAEHSRVIEIVKDYFKSGPNEEIYRRLHSTNIGKTIHYGTGAAGTGKRRSYVVPDTYEQFVEDAVQLLYPEAKYTELTKKALKHRRGKITAVQADSMSFRNELSRMLNGNLGDPKDFSRIPTVAAPTAAAPTVAAPEVNIEDLPDEVKNTVDDIVGNLSNKRSEFEASINDLVNNTPPEHAADDALKGYSPRTIAIRNLLSNAAKEHFDSMVTEMGEGATAVNPRVTLKEDGHLNIAPSGDDIEFNRTMTYAIAHDINKAIELHVSQMHAMAVGNDPVLYAAATMDAVDHLLNETSADTIRQVMQYLNDKHGIRMPSMTARKTYMSELLQTGQSGMPKLFEGIEYTNTRGELKTIDPKALVRSLNEYFHNSFIGMNSSIGNRTGLQLIPTVGNLIDTTKLPFRVVSDSASMEELKGAVNAISRPIARGMSREYASALRTLVNKGLALVYKEHVLDDTDSISGYTLLDHLMFGPKANAEATISATAPGKYSIGRAANTGRIPAPLREITPINTDAFPRMDEDVLDAISTLKTYMNSASAKHKDAVVEVMRMLISPDVTRLLDPATGKFDAARSFGSMGIHYGLLHDTAVKGLTTAWKIALADKLWDTPSLMADLNQAVMLGIHHKILNLGLSPEKAADALKESIANFPDVEQLMRDAALSDNVDVPPAPTVEKPEAPKATPEVPVEEVTKPVEEVKSLEEVLNKPVEKPTVTGTPPLSPETKANVKALTTEILSGADIKRINSFYSEARAKLANDLTEFDAMMRTTLNKYEIATHKQLRIMGMPVANLTALNRPVHTYAGVYAMKQRQGFVGNWVNMHITNSADPTIQWARHNLRRPSSMLDAVLNDIRSSISGCAQNSVLAIHEAIRATYKLFDNKDELKAATREFWDPIKDITSAHKLDQVNKRLNDVHNAILDLANIDKARITNFNRADVHDISKSSFITFNNALPPVYRIPEHVIEQVFSGDKRAFAGTPYGVFTRKWLIALSDVMEKADSTHMLARSNIDNIDIGRFEYATQHAILRVKLRSQTYRSMFDNFSFDMSDELVEATNAGRIDDDKYIRLSDPEAKVSSSLIPIEYRNNVVNKGYLEEMRKVMDFIEKANSDRRASDMYYTIGSKVNNAWKSVVTILNIPNYHFGNLMSDVFLNSMDGVGVGAYDKASTVILNSHPASKRMKANPKAYAALMKPDVASTDISQVDRKIQALTDPHKAKYVTTIIVNGKPQRLSSEDIWKLYVEYSLGQNAVTGNLSSAGHLNPTKTVINRMGAVYDGILDLSNEREDWCRLAHFIHALEAESKNGARSFTEISMAARDRVIKYHFDYDDVWEWERATLGRYIPFYKWTRNIVPLSITQYFTNPKSYTIGGALNRALAEVMYPTQYDDQGNPIPIDVVMPTWVTSQGMLPIGEYTDPEGNRQARYATLNLPLMPALANFIAPAFQPWMDPTTSVTTKLRQGVMGEASSIASRAHPLLTAAIVAATEKSPIPGGSIQTDKFEESPLSAIVPFLGAFTQAKDSHAKGIPWSDPVNILKTSGLVRGYDTTDKARRGIYRQQQDRLDTLLDGSLDEWAAQYAPNAKTVEEKKAARHAYFVQQGVLQK